MEIEIGAGCQKSVEDIYEEYTMRRMAIVKALTTDFQDFHRQCDPDKENLCLYGFPNGKWAVNLPVDDIPSELPEPILGINFARDALDEKEWIDMVAIHSDSWLISMVSFFGAKYRFDKHDRKYLYSLINEHPTIHEVINGKVVKPNSTGSNHKFNKSNRKSKPQRASSKSTEKKKNNEEECATCQGSYEGDDFWIYCDTCQRWFHGKCVKVTPSRAENISKYKCPSCSMKRPRPRIEI
ncbi:PHD finger protein ALFIN-LIKE 4 [Zostera marina]|uniref:PHD finger protein ALFIN-LIKE n=1 Tax=Zostera marina TaxID=29655 RepID=A0A0K9PKZ0_ZOSMR|nr:PHD finger protein ALFIN-LIKE 4 [Zostera marina]